MKMSSFLSVVSVVAVLFGIGFIAAPGAVLAQYGITADHYIALMARLFGTALINVGLILWLARNIVDPVGRRAIVLAGLIGDLLGFVVSLHAQMRGDVNALGWSTIAIYGLFALGFAYFQFAPKST